MFKRECRSGVIVSKSPFGKSYVFSRVCDDAKKIDKFIGFNRGKKVVVVQGMGFVGVAMLTAIASAKDGHGRARYAAIGVDLPSEYTYWKIGMINDGKLPVRSLDRRLPSVFREAYKSGNVMATADSCAYGVADVLIVSINLDVEKRVVSASGKKKVFLDKFSQALSDVAGKVKPSCLIIIESTLSPGTCGKVIIPMLKKEFRKRGYDPAKIRLAYSYERVMPGKDYLRSITAYYRVFAGLNAASRRKARAFLDSIIDTKRYPLTELSSITAAEMGKVLENSYRAMNIAFIKEWTELAELAGVNLFEVIEGIRKRDTHKNIMYPGFGVGGYCLTKDPLLADWAAERFFKSRKRLNMSVEAVNINDNMPLHPFRLMKKNLKRLKDKRILLLGASYRKDVADTRYSPSETFYKKCVREGADIVVHDPIVDHWPELGIDIENDLRHVRMDKADAIVLAVNHTEYMAMKPGGYASLLKSGGLILDCNNILSDDKADVLRRAGFRVAGVGKGHWNIPAGGAAL